MHILWILLVSVLFWNKSQNSGSVFLSNLEGKWQRIEKPDNFEIWTKVDEDNLRGENYRIQAEQKEILEKLTLENHDGVWYYIPDVPHNPSPVRFRITEIGDTFFHSQNPDHDFPKWIRYNLFSKDSLNVTIGDEKDTVGFRFKRYN